MATRLQSSFIVLLSIGICAGEGLGGGAWGSEDEDDPYPSEGEAPVLPAPGPGPFFQRPGVGPWGLGGPGGSAGLFAKEPADAVVRKWDDAVLACAAAPAYASWAVSWLKDDEPLSGAAHLTVDDRGGLLIIHNVTNRDVGEYRCQLRGPLGSVLSRAGSVHIASPSHVVSGPENITVPISRTARFSCNVESVPPAKIRWKKDEKVLPTNPRYTLLSTGVLLISEVESSDEGAYRCVATNTVLKKTRSSRDAFLKIGAPHDVFENNFLSQGRVIQSVQGDSVSLECSVRGNEVPVWDLQGKDTSLFESVTKVTLPGVSILTFENVQEAHSGTYNCTVKTAFQTLTQIFELEVFVPATVLEPPRSETYPTAHTVRFKCNVGGVPFPNVTWYRDGVRLNSDGHYKPSKKELLISQSVASDTGFYQCMTRNRWGENWGVAHLYVNSSGLQGVPLNVVCQKQGENSIILHWTAPLANIAAYTVDYWPTANRTAKNQTLALKTYYNITDLKPFTNYTFSVRSYSRGASEPSPEVTCKTKESVPDVAPEIKLMVIGPSKLNVSWVSLDSEKAHGHVTEYKVQWREAGKPTAKVMAVPHEVTSYTINDLIPGKRYEIRVLARTNRGWPKSSVEEKLLWVPFEMSTSSAHSFIPRQNEISIKPHSSKEILLLPPSGLEAEPTSSHGLNFTWNVPLNVDVQYYFVLIREVQPTQSLSSMEPAVINCTNPWVEIHDLQPSTIYELMLKVIDKNGHSSPFSEKIECRTLPDVPGIVTDVSWEFSNSSILKLMWKKPISSVSRFNVSLVPLDGISPTITLTVNGSLTNTEVPGVRPSVPYQLTITGISVVGSGPPYAQVVFISSKEPEVILSPTGVPFASVSQQIPWWLFATAGCIVVGFILAALLCIATIRRSARNNPVDPVPAQSPVQSNGNGIHGQVPLTSFVTPDAAHFQYQLGMRCVDPEAHDGNDTKGLEDTNVTLLHPGSTPTPIGANGGHPNDKIKNLDEAVTSPWSGGLISRHLFHITENPQCDSAVLCKSHPLRYAQDRSEEDNVEEMENLLSKKLHTSSESETEDCCEEAEGDPVGDVSNVTQVTDVDHSFQDKSNNNHDILTSSISTSTSRSCIEGCQSSRNSSFLEDSSEGSNNVTEQQLLVTFSSVPFHLTAKPFMDVPKVSVVGPNG